MPTPGNVPLVTSSFDFTTAGGSFMRAAMNGAPLKMILNMDSYVELCQANGAALITLAEGNRSQQITDGCKKYGGF